MVKPYICMDTGSLSLWFDLLVFVVVVVVVVVVLVLRHLIKPVQVVSH